MVPETGSPASCSSMTGTAERVPASATSRRIAPPVWLDDLDGACHIAGSDRSHAANPRMPASVPLVARSAVRRRCAQATPAEKRNLTEPEPLQAMKMVSVPAGGMSVGPVIWGVISTSWMMARCPPGGLRGPANITSNDLSPRFVGAINVWGAIWVVDENAGKHGAVTKQSPPIHRGFVSGASAAKSAVGSGVTGSSGG